MYINRQRLYMNGVIGAAGGLLAWALLTLLLRFETASTFLLFVKDALLGALVGACIGAAVSYAEQNARGGGLQTHPLLLSALLGAGAGAIGLVLGEGIFLFAGGGVWPRAVGWAIFGALLGAGQWIATGLPAKGIYGALGGLLGGLIGGSTYERLSLALRSAGLDRAWALTVGGAVGLMILGACIVLLIGLVEEVLRRAWIHFENGPLEGKTITLDPSRAALTLGRADQCDVMIRHDPEMAPIHAAIEAQSGRYLLRPRAGRVDLRLGAALTPITAQHLLADGDVVQLSRSRFTFHTDQGPAQGPVQNRRPGGAA